MRQSEPLHGYGTRILGTAGLRDLMRFQARCCRNRTYSHGGHTVDALAGEKIG
jgi:hypothetical protein